MNIKKLRIYNNNVEQKDSQTRKMKLFILIKMRIIIKLLLTFDKNQLFVEQILQ